MSYFIGGSSGESSAFEKTIQNSAIQVLHESQGLVNMTNVVTPNQGNTYKVPSMAPISYGDYTDASANPYGTNEQTATITSKEVVASPAVAQTAFSKFLGWTTAFDLAANLGSELGASFAEKVDQRVSASFVNFKQTVGATNYTLSTSSTAIVDGFNRVSAIGAQELLSAGSTATIVAAGSTAITVTGMIRNVIKAWREARNPGRPTVVLSPAEEQRLLGELTGGAVYQGGTTSINAGLTALGDELLATGMLRNLYGCTVMFTTFLSSQSVTLNDVSTQTVKQGAAIGPQAITTVMVKGLDISMGDKDGGLQTWITGLGYFGSGVVSQARGLAINIQ
jgi:hypothetical protein